MLVSLGSISTEYMESWREVFNLLLIVATLAVCIGVYFERDENPEDVKKFGQGLVFRGIAFEFLFAILLWQVDSIVSTRQKADIADLSNQTESLRAKNLALEAVISPRFINPQIPLAEIEKYAGAVGKIKIMSCPEFEPFRLAGQLNAMLHRAHFNSDIIQYNGEVLFDGIAVKSLPPPAYGPAAITANAAWTRVWEAVNGIVSQLKLSKLDALRSTAFSLSDKNLYASPNEIHILVGRKPVKSDEPSMPEEYKSGVLSSGVCIPPG
jgi:hypothetical protein